MNIEDLSTQLMYTTAPLYAMLGGNKVSTGTGFVFSVNLENNVSIPLLITNYHVVENAITGYIELHLSDNETPTNEVVKVAFDSSVINNGKLGALDLVALPLAGAINDFQNRGKKVFFKSIDASIIPQKNVIDDLAAIESITFIGYPNSIYDIQNKLPVIRQGITATPIWNDFQGKEEFLIDAGVFQGSSGSPVFIYNQGSFPSKDGVVLGSRILFVGILTRTLQRTEDNVYLDLGVVINSGAFLREINNYIIRKTGKSIEDK